MTGGECFDIQVRERIAVHDQEVVIVAVDQQRQRVPRTASRTKHRLLPGVPNSRAVAAAIADDRGNTGVAGYAGMLSPFTLVDGIQVALFNTEASTPAGPPGTIGGLIFLGLQAYEWTHLLEHESIRKNNFGATFFILTGFHGMHVFGGVVYLSIILLIGLTGRFTPENNSEVEIAGLYWHFVDLVWILVFTFVYLL